MANLGVGLGAFLTGMNQGVKAYEGFEQARDRKRMRGIAQEGAVTAKAARDADINNAVTAGSADQNGMTVPTYQVGNRSYKDEASAREAAEKETGTFMDYYTKTVLPEYQQHWMETGDVQKAQALEQWMEDANVKKGTKAWANAVRSFQLGDSQGFKDNLMKAYNQKGYYDDGMTATGIEDVNNDKGQLLGYKITFKDGDGKEFTNTYDGDDVAKLGLQALAPDKVLSYGLDQLKQRDAARLQLAKEERGLSRDLLKVGVQNDAKMGQLQYASTLRRQENAEKVQNEGAGKKVAQADAIVGALRKNGTDEQTIKSLYPQLLGVERASRSARDRLDGYIETMAKSDLDFSALPPAEQVARARKMMDEIDSAAREQAPGNAPVQTTSASAGNPVQSRGVPVIDTRTGQITYQ